MKESTKGRVSNIADNTKERIKSMGRGQFGQEEKTQGLVVWHNNKAKNPR